MIRLITHAPSKNMRPRFFMRMLISIVGLTFHKRTSKNSSLLAITVVIFDIIEQGKLNTVIYYRRVEYSLLRIAQ